mmetsp:Transcript_22357/g.69067  ORF Transcript_22357/g.69067 Transcript_22357/m.69067 type:complete len:260 (-) Transcript_22357:1458-2237(-)|eukprot:CAMPEP_0118887794 /NCGR_PEP_ID=MMETSP1163-20130328/25370_1 /TAXON_ID=124430 /ORGANISM="Phaeomonas parva, Strain CCMP2877" /LENGTH=259 /DNA_ID=CAMNT_0006826303 /DNA_START=69 /DNA_END=848 /DNA_ORIENTATION=+
MASSGAGYDYSATTYSVDGRIFQVEYAGKAVENAGTAIGVRCSDGVVIAAENVKLFKMMVPNTNRLAQNVDKHIIAATTGFAPDGRQLLSQARDEAHHYEDTFHVPIPPEMLANRMSQFVHYFTLHGSLRPFGATMLCAGYDEEKQTHELYMVEPSGQEFRYYGCATGKGRQAAKTEVEKLPLNEITAAEAVKEIAKIYYTLHDDAKDKPFALDMQWITEGTDWTAASVPLEVVDEAIEWAKNKIAEEDDMDEDDEDDA